MLSDMPVDMQGEERPKLTRRPGACQLCRKKKVRCNGERQCNLCKRYGLICVYEPTQGQQLVAPVADETLSTLCDQTQQTNREANNDDASSVANWSLPADAAPFAADLESIFVDDEQLAFHPNFWVRTTELAPLSPPLSTATRPRNDENVITGNTQPSSQAGKDDGYNVYLENHTNDFDLSLPVLEPAAPSMFSASRKRKRDDLVAAADDHNDSARHRPFDIDLLPSPRRTALQVLQVRGCNGVTCTSQNSHVDDLTTLLSSSKLSPGRRDKATKLVCKLLCRNNLLGIPAHWTDELEKMKLSGDELKSGQPPLKPLIERCFQEPSGPQLILDPGEIIAEARECCDACYTSEHNAQTEILYYVLAFWGFMLETAPNPKHGCSLLLRIQEAWHRLLLEPESVEKFIALVVLIQVTQRFGICVAPSVTSQAIVIVQTLKLHCAKTRQQLCPDPAMRVRLERALQLVFSLDRHNVLRWESFSMLPVHIVPNAVNPLPEDDQDSSRNEAEEWLGIQYRYGHIVDSFLQSRQFTQNEPQTCTHSRVIEDLSFWHGSLSESQQTNKHALATISRTRHASISISFQYHEAVLSVLLSASTQGARNAAAQSTGMTSIREILSTSNMIENYLQDRTLLYVPALALCVLAVEQLVMETPDVKCIREGRALLAMALGFFGRLSSVLPSHDYFDLVTELVDLVGLSNTVVKKP